MLAYFGATLLVRIILAARRIGTPLQLQVHTDAKVLLFTIAVTLFTALLFGLLPALRALRPSVAPSLQQTSRGGETRSRRFFGKCLVAGKWRSPWCYSALPCSSSAICRTWSISTSAFNVTISCWFHSILNTAGLEGEQLSRAYRELLAPLAAIPGVRSVSLCGATPISGAGANRAVIVPGYDPKPGEIRNVAENWVAPKYFETLGTPLLAGRDFDFRDQGRPRVAIINQTMAHYYFGGSQSARRRAFPSTVTTSATKSSAWSATRSSTKFASLPTAQFISICSRSLRPVRDLSSGPTLIRTPWLPR